MPTHARCVERCIESIAYCKAAAFTPYKEKSIGVCTLYSENSEQQPTALRPDSSIEAVSTVHELLLSCPQFALSEITYMISTNHRKKLEHGRDSGRAPGNDDMRSDAFFPDQDHFGEDIFRLTLERHATMTPLYPDEGSQKPSSPRMNSLKSSLESRDAPSSSHPESTYPHRPKFPFEGVQPIIPVAVLHMGQAIKPGYVSCKSGASCVPTPALDSCPCPARQGDPCAPRPPCHPISCSHADAHIVMSTWMEWSPCSQSCGAGVRMRQCSGVDCVGPRVESCVLLAICQEWSTWSTWSICSTTCGEGERKRTRECIGGHDCSGVSATVETCAAAPCPVWSDWGPWEGCSLTCGQGQKRRSRKCLSKTFCPGPLDESRVCNLGECPQWGVWTSWSTCTRTCNTGEMLRTRECENGEGCEGASEERLLCNQHDCPTWMEWTAWTVCTNKCDEESFRIRNRVCLYRGMAHTGCEGPAQDQSSCPTHTCPTWSDWGDWSVCSATCGQGSQHRIRSCENGVDCPGSNRELRFCQLASCPYWDEWMTWSGCSVTCGIGICERRRRCVTDDLLNLPNSEELDDALFEVEAGPADREEPVLVERSRSAARSSGYHNRTNEDGSRRAAMRSTIEGSGVCTGSDIERKPCDAGPCCSWNSWNEWSTCTECDPQSVSRRSRMCKMIESTAVFTPIAAQLDYHHRKAGGGGGAPRLLDIYTTGILKPMTPIVPVNHRKRRQAPSPQTGVECCIGSSFETRPCRTSCDRPRPCEWMEWGEWCGCTRCRAGKETRRRFCGHSYPTREPTLKNPSCYCAGVDTEQRECILERACDPMRSSEGGTAPNLGVLDQHLPDQRLSYVPFDPIREKEELPKYVDDYRIHNLNRKDSTLSTTTFSYSVCRWSKWSEWSSCDNIKKRHRNRLCIGNDELVSDCECMGYSTEEDRCDSTGTMSRVINEVNFSIGDGNPDTKTSSSNHIKHNDNIHSALKVDESSQNKNEVSLTASVIKTEKCEWTRWSQWSACTVSCGSGDRVRKRRCSCGEVRCGNGLDQETSKCNERKCDKKMPPTFKID